MRAPIPFYHPSDTVPPLVAAAGRCSLGDNYSDISTFLNGMLPSCFFSISLSLIHFPCLTHLFIPSCLVISLQPLFFPCLSLPCSQTIIHPPFMPSFCLPLLPKPILISFSLNPSMLHFLLAPSLPLIVPHSPLLSHHFSFSSSSFLHMFHSTPFSQCCVLFFTHSLPLKFFPLSFSLTSANLSLTCHPPHTHTHFVWFTFVPFYPSIPRTNTQPD